MAEREKNGPFNDLFDFCERVDGKSANKGCMESLIKAGAFDSISKGYGRATLLAALEDAMANGAKQREDRDSGQMSLFGGDDDGGASASAKARVPQVPEWSDKQRLEEEKKVLGFYFSGHPLAEARELVEGCSSCNIKRLSEFPEGYEVIIGAYVTAIRTMFTKAKNEKMGVLTIEDFTGSTEVVLFPKTFDKVKDLVAPDRILFFRGKIKANEMGGGAPKAADAEGEAQKPQVSILADDALTPEQVAERHISDVIFTVEETAPGEQNPNPVAALTKLNELLQLLKAHPGKTPIYFNLMLDNVDGASAMVRIKAGDKFKINATPELFLSLRKVLRVGAIRVTGEGTKASKPVVPAWKQRKQELTPVGPK